MKRIIGIILILAGIALAFVAYSRHDQEKTILDLGKVEIKNENKAPSENTTLYYAIAAICIVGGGFLVSSKK